MSQAKPKYESPVERRLRKLEELKDLREKSKAHRIKPFQIRYRDDPVAFIHDVVEFPDGAKPAPYQDEVMAESYTRGRAAIRSPWGAGKSTMAAWRLLHWALTRDLDRDWKIPTTASVWLQLQRYFWPEVHAWARRIRWDKVGREPLREGRELLDMSLELGSGEAFAMSPSKHEYMEGGHAPSMCFILDEAKIVPDLIWDMAEGALVREGSGGDEASELAISTPGGRAGRFFQIHRKEPKFAQWWTRHITLEEAIAAGRVTAQWAEARRIQWGEESDMYQTRVLGEFGTGENEAVPLAWVEAAQERWRVLKATGQLPEEELDVLGCDIADTGSDETIFARRVGDVIVGFDSEAGGRRDENKRPDYGQEILAAGGRISNILKAHSSAIALVDVLGPGAATYQEVVQEVGRKRVIPYNGWLQTDWTDSTGELRFANVRSAAMWNLREALNPSSGRNVALPPDDQLTADLTAPEWLPENRRGQRALEPKEELKKRLGRSPDRGDAVAESFWAEAERGPATVGTLPADIRMPR